MSQINVYSTNPFCVCITMVISRFLQIVKKNHKLKDFMMKIWNFLHLERKPIYREPNKGKKLIPRQSP